MRMPTTLTGRYSPGKRFGLTSSICFQPTFLFLPETKAKRASIHWRKGSTYRDEYLTGAGFRLDGHRHLFLVQTPEGATVFHAGDLNNWHWMDESPEEEWKRDEAFFLRELEDIAVCKAKMDVVLFRSTLV